MTRFLFAVVAISVLSGCIPNQETEPTVDLEAEILAVQQTVEDWLNMGVASLDTTVTGRYMTASFGSMEPGWRDRNAFLEWVTTFDEDFGGPGHIHYSFSDWETKVMGDVAWTSVVNNATLSLSGEEPRQLKWTETGVLVKRSDGRWLIDRYHSTYWNMESE